MAGLAQLVNDKTASVSFEGKTIYLDNDLDLSGCQWTPIGNGSNFGRYFAGTFDGQYHKITNLHHHSTGDELIRNGLFGVVSDGGTLKNLLVIDADIASMMVRYLPAFWQIGSMAAPLKTAIQAER